MELQLVAGAGDQTVMLDRKDYTRIQFGQGQAARSYWFGRTRVGTKATGPFWATPAGCPE
jgi:hypothetical protein